MSLSEKKPLQSHSFDFWFFSRMWRQFYIYSTVTKQRQKSLFKLDFGSSRNLFCSGIAHYPRSSRLSTKGIMRVFIWEAYYLSNHTSLYATLFNLRTIGFIGRFLRRNLNRPERAASASVLVRPRLKTSAQK